MKRPCVCEDIYNVRYLTEVPQIFPLDGTSYTEKLVNFMDAQLMKKMTCQNVKWTKLHVGLCLMKLGFKFRTR